ncbi:MAG: DNA topoisomerase IV subunit A [Nitrososphaerota archaeon]|jgi:DNA topoisomerase-6 subunit A|nr:DNA topoisomerase IV subunit A [Nitrososphaerota archaeon]MDG7036101.1 DNA topoisomerase IV subunit A [Nitrososphaerota archaeon]MDG7040629.1 DNA topoisomerase IV subunit A [Nitrososphaerota archaeon]MDG7041548.1 DNA topoisomerase IV subunit A [Nitrososphaerota archaeon]MDG7042498.1 DNA topoisomerase IV subunit A [Nitrososphaerota archaeon]
MKGADRKSIVRDQLHEMGVRIYDLLDSGKYPDIEMPSRSVKNIEYDPKLRQYVLGPTSVKRNAKNIKHIRPFTQLVWLASFSKELLSNRKTSTLRDIFYSAQAYNIDFEDQNESDEVITELESILGKAREDFNVYPEERSAIFGDLTIEYTVPGYEGKRLDLTSHPDGVMIGPALTTAAFAQTNAEMVLVIEKGALFTRFVEEKVYKKYNAILIDTVGQPPRSTRYMIRRLHEELGLPVYVFTDADPWGMHIAMVIISGSANAAHLRELTTPDAKWAGVWASDINKYKLPHDPLTELDVKRLFELKSDPRYGEKLWKDEMATFLKYKRKAEQEAFARYGLTYIVDKYLPDKLKLLKEQ